MARPVQPLLGSWDTLQGPSPDSNETFRVLNRQRELTLPRHLRLQLPREPIFKSPSHIRTTSSACSNHQRRLTLWRSTATPTATSPAYFLTLQLSVAAGHWADATAHIKPGAAQKLSLSLPESDSGYQISDGYIYAGDDLATANATRMLNTGGP